MIQLSQEVMRHAAGLMNEMNYSCQASQSAIACAASMDDIDRELEEATSRRQAVAVMLLSELRAPKINVYTLPVLGPLAADRWYDVLSDRAFIQRLRLPKALFEDLLLRCRLSPSWPVGRRQSHITDGTWLAAVLYQLAHGCESAVVASMFEISASGFSLRRRDILSAIIEALANHPDARLGWPDTKDGWLQLAHGFVPSLHSRCFAFMGTVAAGDGTFIPLSLRGVNEDRKQAYHCRKASARRAD